MCVPLCVYIYHIGACLHIFIFSALQVLLGVRNVMLLWNMKSQNALKKDMGVSKSQNQRLSTNIEKFYS